MSARTFALVGILGLSALGLFGCDSEKAAGDPPAVEPTKTEPAAIFADYRLLPSEVTPEIQADMDKTAPADGEEVVVFDTSMGKVVVMLYEKVTPKTVANFKKLVRDAFYDGTRFHRCIPTFMIQGGDPNSKKLDMSDGLWGMGGPGYMIEDELNPIEHKQGVLSMAHAGPGTGGSQFFIMDGDAPHLNYVHSAFGRVVSGQDVVAKIIATGNAAGTIAPDKAVVLKKATVETWPIK